MLRGQGGRSIRPMGTPRYYTPRSLNDIRETLPEEIFWKSHWPFRISALIAIGLAILSITLIALDIALLSTGTTYFGWYIVTSRTGVSGSAVGIWGGTLLLVTAVFMGVINCVKFVARWILAGVSLSFLGLAVTIVLIGINAARVKYATDLQDILSFSDYTQGKLSAAELALSIVAFFHCLAFILVYFYSLYRVRRNRRNPSRQPPIQYRF